MQIKVAVLIVGCLFFSVGLRPAKADVLHEYILNGTYAAIDQTGEHTDTFTGFLIFDATTVSFTSGFIQMNDNGSVGNFTNLGGFPILAANEMIGPTTLFHLGLSEDDGSDSFLDFPLDFAQTLIAGLPTFIDRDAVGVFKCI